MSKRICNKKGRVGARFGRVRIGWKKKRILSELEKINKAEQEGNLEEKVQEGFNTFKDYAKTQLKRFYPKDMMRRHQAR
jgi:hypothetical protein